MRKAILYLVLLFSVQLVSSQIRSYKVDDKKDDPDVTLVSHTVMMGETIKLISQRYLVTPAAIYKVNKAAVDGISPGMVLQIPTKPKAGKARRTESVSDPSTDDTVRHEVASGETLESIAGQYNISPDDLKQANPSLSKRSLHTGETIKIPASGGVIPSNEGISASSATQSAVYEVVSGDTLSGIAQQYNTTIAELKSLNPKLKSRGLQTGETIKVPVQ